MRTGLLPEPLREFAPEISYVEVPKELSPRVDCIPARMTDFGEATSKKTRASVEKRRASPGHANIAFIPWCELMKPLLHRSEVSRGSSRVPRIAALYLLALAGFCASSLWAQDDPLNKVHVPPPSTTNTPPTGAPTGVDAPAITGAPKDRVKPGSVIRMNVDMVLVPVTVTDPMNRLVTGLEKEDFSIFENNGVQRIKTFAAEDAPVSIGIVFDLSGSMNSKLVRARESILQFAKTANPEDEFFVIGFNDRQS